MFNFSKVFLPHPRLVLVVGIGDDVSYTHPWLTSMNLIHHRCCFNLITLLPRGKKVFTPSALRVLNIATQAK